ncbi:copper chaperone PCu(A)C [Streptomyces polyrhachis]|uniref:Copper chaperone PCu(A)C n=1 Tax=Streptomyces polyrhachis TaxID=1282885 RepID=A0ABW2GB54_9ACTN
MRPRTALLLPALAVALAAPLTACSGGQAPKLSAGSGFVPQPALADVAAGYLTVRNDGDAADTLTSVTSSLAGRITLHTSDGTRMKKVDRLDVPAGGALELARGGSHLMLEKLDRRPRVGERVTLVLHFAKSGPIEIQLPVEPPTYRPRQETHS